MPIEPTVVRTAEVVLIRNASAQLNGTMCTPFANQPKATLAIAVKHQVFAKDTYLPHWILEKLSKRGNWDPVAAHQLAAWRSGPNAGQSVVGFLTEHLNPFQKVMSNES